jgi:multisubunit Na+/H+ antiporter MnhF subunit
MQQENFSEQNSLQLIESMINKAKNKFSENGTLYLLWGYTVLLCSIAQFVLQEVFKQGEAQYVWMLTWLVVIYQVFFLIKKKKKIKVRTYTDEIIGFVWLAFVACLFLTIFILGYHKQYALIDSAVLVLYGVPTFLSGAILKFKPLMIGGICCWILAAISPFVIDKYHFLLLCAAVIAAWIIPGHLLRIRYKKEN